MTRDRGLCSTTRNVLGSSILVVTSAASTSNRHFRAATGDVALARTVLWEWPAQPPGWGDPPTWQCIQM